MKKALLSILFLVVAGFAFVILAGSSGNLTVEIYDDVTLSGGFQSGHFENIWDISQCDLTLSFTVDLNGMVDDFGGAAHAWSE